MKTVKQIADEMGITKQALQKRIAREPLYTTLTPYISIKGTTKYIDDVGETLIISAFSGIDKSTGTPIGKGTDKGIDSIRTGIDTISESLIDLLKLDIEAKNRQMDGMQRTIDAQQETIHTQAENIKELTASLNAAQALHAGTIHAQLEASATAEQEPDAPVEDALHPVRRWWQFWR